MLAEYPRNAVSTNGRHGWSIDCHTREVDAMSVCTEPNLRQTRTAGDLLRHIENEIHGPATLYLAPCGSVGSIIAIICADDNPAPNPIVRLWGIDGNAYIVESENDYARWLESFKSDAVRLGLKNARDFIAAVERADDDCYVIHSGGSYEPHNPAS